MNEYAYSTAKASCSSEYVWSIVFDLCNQIQPERILDLGCGNGALCEALSASGYNVQGCDNSSQGIEFARAKLPSHRFEKCSVYDPPPYGREFDLVISTEVIEHLFFPRALPQFASKVMRPDGRLIVSTPYHGYLKNLALAIAGKWDSHFTALWDCGHIKFWSRDTICRLMASEGFECVEFHGCGRLPLLWKSMVLAFRHH